MIQISSSASKSGQIPSMLLVVLTDWLDIWNERGWVNSAGQPVANQALIKHAALLRDDLEDEGREVELQYIPRENYEADILANLGCDEVARHMDLAVQSISKQGCMLN